MTSRTLSIIYIAGIAVGASGCSAVAPPPAEPTSTAAVYDGSSFAIPFRAEIAPEYLEPEVFGNRELLWVSESTEDQVVRFVAPMEYFPWGETTATPGLPDDYVAYLETLVPLGATFEDVGTIDIDGHDAAIMTVTTTQNLNGTLGCWNAKATPDEDCFGFQAALDMRFLALDLGDEVLIAWARAEKGSSGEQELFDGFEKMMGTIDLL